MFYFDSPRARRARGMVPLEGGVIDCETVHTRSPPDQWSVRIVVHPVYAQLCDRESFLVQAPTQQLQVGGGE